MVNIKIIPLAVVSNTDFIKLLLVTNVLNDFHTLFKKKMYKKNLKIDTPSKNWGDADFIEVFRFPNGSSLPPSYKTFCLELGYGRLCKLFLIYIPLKKAHVDAWQVQNKDLKGLFQSYLNPPLYSIASQEGAIKLIETAEPFAMSENGEFLFWDISNPLSNGEFPIYFTDFSNGVHFAGNSLLEFINIVTHPDKFKSVLKFYQRPLEKCFEGFQNLHLS